MAEVKLIGWDSPFLYRAIWALKLKDIPYEFVKDDFYNKSPSLLKYNPVHKKIPVLVHGGKPICESMIIVEYIDEAWPQNPLRSTDLHERATARFWVKFVDDEGSSIFKIFRTSGEALEQALKENHDMLQTMEDHGIGEKKFFGGDKIGIADLAFGSIIHWLTIFEEAVGVKVFEAHKFPRLYAWFKNFQQEPVIRENLPDWDATVSMFRAIREKLLGAS